MSLQMGQSGPPEKVRTFRGTWHAADVPGVSQTGTLTLTARSKPELILNGTLQPESPDYEDKTLLGRAHDGTSLTLVHARYRSQHAPWYSDQPDEHPVLSETWNAWAVAVGVHLPLAGDTPVRELIFRSRMLREWAKPLAPPIEMPEDFTKFGGYLTTPEPLACDIPQGRLELRWHIVASSGGSGTSVEVVPEISVQYSEAHTIDETWEMTVLPLLHMLTFFVGAGDTLEALYYREKPEDISLRSHALDSYGHRMSDGRFEWITASWMAYPSAREVPFVFAHLVHADELTDTFGDVIRAWFQIESRLAGPLLDYFSVSIWPQMTAEETFYRVVRALEVVHGLIDKGVVMPKAEFRKIKDDIRSVLAGNPHEELIMSRLINADTMTLRERLHTLVSSLGPRLEALVLSRPNFVQRVVQTRNNMTHGAKSGPLERDELFEAERILNLIMIHTLLGQLGVPVASQEDMIFRTDAARPLGRF